MGYSIFKVNYANKNSGQEIPPLDKQLIESNKVHEVYTMLEAKNYLISAFHNLEVGYGLVAVEK